MTNAFNLNPKITLSFISGLPQNTPLLKVHCQSEDDDLRVRTLKVGDKFDFSFHMNFIGTTLYHCSFSWGLKFNNFDVFKLHKSYCG
uniref:S-protein homolog n=1 Tax=Nicotiana sylvestris TaxID=4096 RepID=A0A1U7YNN5_NICSY